MPTQPAYTDGEGQSFLYSNQFQAGIQVLAQSNEIGSIDFRGDSNADPVLMSLTDNNDDGRIYIYGPDAPWSSERFQHWQPLDGFISVQPVPGSAVSLGNAADPPTVANTIGKVARTAQSAAIAATNLTDTTPAGLYEISYYASCTTANPVDGTIALRIDYTDINGATSQTAPVPLSLAATSTGTTAHKGVLVAKLASGNIQYSTVLVGAQTTSRYALDVRCTYKG